MMLILSYWLVKGPWVKEAVIRDHEVTGTLIVNDFLKPENVQKIVFHPGRQTPLFPYTMYIGEVYIVTLRGKDA